MGGLFGSKPKPVKAPPVPDPAPIPEVSDDTSDEAMRKAVKESSRAKTKITGNLAPVSQKKRLLG